ncbi:OmpA family protein [Tahibacter soli]|uniref:OmpA family protein n=1 Tax=Tahibacter soli TaxID=2983605 RepID=A0A9X3YP91_9GAMM|nr:OmpA family protein [Tahibacter soli]MDC8014378.1 OmpA family protein [Tahibacter soli]
MDSKKIAELVLLAGLILTSLGCQRNTKSDESATDVASFQFNKILFQPGRPRAGEALADAMAPPGIDQLRNLETNAYWLRKVPGFQVEIAGTTDNAECAGVDCHDLSTRRARMVYDWLRNNGVPDESIYAFRGFATEKPISNNRDEEERQRSRSVDFGVIRTSYGRTDSLIDNAGHIDEKNQ